MMIGTYETHPAADVFPMLEGADLDALAADIKAHGLDCPVVLLDGVVIDGRNRLTACLRSGVEPRFTAYDGPPDVVRWVVSQNLHRRHLNESQRAMAASAIAKLPAHRPSNADNGSTAIAVLPPTVSQDAAAEMLNVSVDSVQRARAVTERGTPELADAVRSGKVAVSTAATVARHVPREEQRRIVLDGPDAVLAKAKEIRAERTAAARAAGERPTDDDSWSTPDHIIEAARAALGTIDLDPATNAAAQARVRAATYYTAENSGLDPARPWRGRVWMNPPYSHPLVEQFTSRLLEEYDAGHVTEAIILLNNASDTKWMQAMFRPGATLLLVRGRVRFVNERNEAAMSPRDAQFILYYGPHPERFREAFATYGTFATFTTESM